jgi:steroid Delta-isomerase
MSMAITSISDPRVQRIAHFFESLTPQSVQQLGLHYTSEAYFKDPFNEVQGLAQIERIFSHMYVALHEPRFVVTSAVSQADACFLIWDFKFRFKRFDTVTEQTVRGCSHLQFNADGKIHFHRDYWDAAEELYEKLPVVRLLMRWLKARANT